MKKISIIALLAVSVATSVMAASVVGSRHDMVFSGFAVGAGGSTEVCIFCHTPHGGQTSVTLAPLWNNTAVASVGTLYNSTTMNFTATVEQVNATDARLCLACHDGGVGMPVNQPNSGDMDPTAAVMSPNALLTTDLSNDHPIGMDLGLNPEGIDPGIRPLATIIGATGFNENPFYGAANTMWCSTCHDVHDGDPLTAPFLRISNAGSAMCKACHIK
ncbi:MAG: hypothetical protein IBX46_13065 [Desulfuromonadales bacterium]|nr:hypothetical protein [Desulfuromonadales bacterium]